MGKYLDDAKAMYNYARIELQQWQDSNDEILLRDAAERTWGAVTLATNDLLESYGRGAPSGTGARQSELQTLEQQHPHIRRLWMLARFASMNATLYKDCAYDGDCRKPLIPDVIEDGREYIDDVELLISTGCASSR